MLKKGNHMAEVAERDAVYTANPEGSKKSQAWAGVVAGLISTGC